MTQQPNSSTIYSIALEEAQTTTIFMCKCRCHLCMNMWMLMLFMDELCRFGYVDVMYE
jgi:hypothetical protein